MRNLPAVLTVIFSLLLIFVAWVGITLQFRKNVSLEDIFIHNEIPLKDLTQDVVQNSNQGNDAIRGSALIDSSETDKGDNLKVDYYIIVGSYGKIYQAQQKAEKLTKDFNANIIILPPTKEGYYRISFGKYSTQEEAKSTINQIRNSINPDAWIFTLNDKSAK